MSSSLVSRKSPPLKGTIQVPGDKSLSHRALMISALTIGHTPIFGLLEGEDVLHTAQAMRQFGAKIKKNPDDSWSVWGCGIGGLQEPSDMLDMGNAGTGVRLLMGLAATHPFTSFFTGDSSLRSRPMRRVIDPLKKSGADFIAREGGKLPLAVVGTRNPLPIDYTLPVASAQVKSAILFAGLNTQGITRIIEPQASRDHTELMLKHFGADLQIEVQESGIRVITLVGQPELKTPERLIIPSDPSSAAFPTAAALLVEDSDILLTNVGVNPFRIGFYETLLEMGADIEILNPREECGEKVADLRVRFSSLKGVDIPAERAPSMIDEYPILAVLAAFSNGITRMFGLSELRVKESDRFKAIVTGLSACGVSVEEQGDTLIVHGTGKPVQGGARIAVNLDHRIAMSFLVLGLASLQAVKIDDRDAIKTSFPDFVDLMKELGANIISTEL